jgi:hypothetical protein
MLHLIDASSLIEAKDRYYGMDFCPGFWAWLDRAHAAGRVASIDRIASELAVGTDALAEWAKARKATFFLPLTPAAAAEVPRVNAWVQGAGFKPSAVRTFFKGADPFLIAYALAHGHTVVTDEVEIPGERKHVKIPVVCRQFGVPCVNLFDLLRAEGARLVL